MAEWRFARGWSDAELERRIDASRHWPKNVPEDDRAMNIAQGWSHYGSAAVIAREAAGTPVPDGPFERACELVRRYEFSDPRIVTSHYAPDVPLLGRRMLLEIRVLGLHFLSGVVVDRVRDESDETRSVWGYRYSTLDGHLETGSEWFLLEKDHATGEVRFTIRAHWRRGQLPNWWSRIGFKLLVKRYQRAWHRLAYVQMRSMLGQHDLPPLPSDERLVHRGPPLPAPMVQTVARVHHPPQGPNEVEVGGPK